MKLAIAVIGGMVLAGCQSSKPVAEMSYSEVKQLAEVIAQRCAAQGAGRGTPEWDACTKQESGREVARRDRLTKLADSDPGPVICNRFGTTTICN